MQQPQQGNTLICYNSCTSTQLLQQQTVRITLAAAAAARMPLLMAARSRNAPAATACSVPFMLAAQTTCGQHSAAAAANKVQQQRLRRFCCIFCSPQLSYTLGGGELAKLSCWVVLSQHAELRSCSASAKAQIFCDIAASCLQHGQQQQ
jgi:hypothetical protein